ncbi:hypothetical protein DWW79_04215 [Alistipes sp. AF17-16]|uniref:hypothetical protein n=1 Tax=Alistipes TaxID=239759 RepID=UPI000E4734AF|nr:MULTISPECIES: hypothetical protein [Alistipes]RHR64325.1 hypothetical protein DWW79_04215 [Alistipes sp. AF17-16]
MKVPYDLQEAWIIREELSCDELASLRIVYWAWMDGFIVTIEEAGIVHRYVRYIRAVCAIRDLFTCADFFSFAVISSSIFSGRDFRWKLKLPLIFMYCGSMPHAAVVLNR